MWGRLLALWLVLSHFVLVGVLGALLLGVFPSGLGWGPRFLLRDMVGGWALVLLVAAGLLILVVAWRGGCWCGWRVVLVRLLDGFLLLALTRLGLLLLRILRCRFLLWRILFGCRLGRRSCRRLG